VRLRAKDEEEKWIKTFEFWKKSAAPPLLDKEGSPRTEEPERDGQMWGGRSRISVSLTYNLRSEI
jgi:hypothetical protein